MREFKGEWRDLLNGFMIALDLRKIFLAFIGMMLTIILLGFFTFGWVATVVGDHNNVFEYYQPTDKGEVIASVKFSENFTPHRIYNWFKDRWASIYSQRRLIWIPYTLIAAVLFILIWSYFGGAIARSAAYEIAKEGEKIETTKALKFSSSKYMSFFWAPLLCLIGLLFFYLCCFVGGLFFKILDLVWVGAPFAALFAPLALLAGFIITLVVLGSIFGLSLFFPAVAAEGTDAFDAVSRGFSYVFSKPWHYIWYQLVSGVYGYICIAFVILFTVFTCWIGLQAGAYGFELAGYWDKGEFREITNASWNHVLSQEHYARYYPRHPVNMLGRPHPYGWIMKTAAKIVRPRPATMEFGGKRLHFLATILTSAWLIVAMGFAYAFAISYFISQQTAIYFILRKKVDDIDVKEIYLEEEERIEETVPTEIKVEKPQETPEEKEEKK